MKQQRGLNRRQSLIDAGGRLLQTVGPGKFSARRVAAEAGVPLAAVTYYFASLDELLGLATELVVASWLDHGPRVAHHSRGADMAQIATTLTLALMPPGPPPASIAEHRRSIQARYEQLLSAGRAPMVSAALAALRPALYELITVIVANAEAPVTLSPATILAVIDGAAVGAISEATDDPVQFITAILTETLQ